jgi:hypothetical protein
MSAREARGFRRPWPSPARARSSSAFAECCMKPITGPAGSSPRHRRADGDHVPTAIPGRRDVIEAFEAFAPRRPSVSSSLARRRYLGLLKIAATFVGNHRVSTRRRPSASRAPTWACRTRSDARGAIDNPSGRQAVVSAVDLALYDETTRARPPLPPSLWRRPVRRDCGRRPRHRRAESVHAPQADDRLMRLRIEPRTAIDDRARCTAPMSVRHAYRFDGRDVLEMGCRRLRHVAVVVRAVTK